MKRNLFVYGCSFTRCYECDDYHEYCKNYKTSEDDLSWSQIVAKKLDLHLHNYGIGLNSNDKILDSIIDSFDLIKENDIVIIQISFYHRYDIPYLDNKKLITIAPNPEQLLNVLYKENNNEYNKKEVEHLTYMSVLMDNELFRDRQLKRFDFIKNILINFKKVKKCIIWDIEKEFHNYENIAKATNNNMADMHWSFKGNRDFANYILTLI